MKQAFIDLDGVVADFHKSAFRLHGAEAPEVYPPGEDAWVPTCLGITDAEFWRPVDHDFWCNLELMPDAKDVLDLILSYIPIENCAFLTSPTIHAPAASGKMKWIIEHFPQFKRRFLIGACKEMCAGPNKILIDDLEKNIEGFQKAGGTGLLLPRPWNSRRNESTLDVLAIELERFTGS